MQQFTLSVSVFRLSVTGITEIVSPLDRFGCRGYNGAVVYRLHPREHSEQTLRLGFGVGWRVFFALVAIAFGVGAVEPAGINLFRAVVAVFAAGAAIYVEEWVFDKTRNCVRVRTGVLGLSRKHELVLSDVTAIVCRSTYPPGLGPAAESAGEETGGSGGHGTNQTAGDTGTPGGVPPVGTSTGFEFLRRSSGGMLPRGVRGGHVRLWLELKNGERMQVITDSVRAYGWVSDLGRTIAAFTRTPFREE